MTLSEAAQKCCTKHRCIARQAWWYGTHIDMGAPVKIEPTNSPCKCIVWIAEKGNSISEWTPMLDDLVADDWIVC